MKAWEIFEAGSLGLIQLLNRARNILMILSTLIDLVVETFERRGFETWLSTLISKKHVVF